MKRVSDRKSDLKVAIHLGVCYVCLSALYQADMSYYRHSYVLVICHNLTRLSWHCGFNDFVLVFFPNRL